MANGKLRDYVWRVLSFLAARSEFLDTEHPAFQFPEPDLVENTKTLQATLIFRDGSRLHVRATLDIEFDVREFDYAYVYYDSRGARVFQYDDAPHHPGVATHPHHLHRGENRVRALDVPRVDFFAMLEQVLNHLR
jgi:hypothetical protein